MEKYLPLHQMVPSALCLTCDVCCRFPEETSVLAPFFTGEEIGLLSSEEKQYFQPLTRGSKIKLRVHGDGCVCPFFDPATHHCQIYEKRPLDCRIYPFAIMRDGAGGVVLGMDTKCPFIQWYASDPEIEKVSDEVFRFLESDPIMGILAAHPDLIGPYQEDVIILRSLDRFEKDRLENGRGRDGSLCL